MWAVIVLGYWARLFAGIVAALLSITWLLHIALCAVRTSRLLLDAAVPAATSLIESIYGNRHCSRKRVLQNAQYMPTLTLLINVAVQLPLDC